MHKPAVAKVRESTKVGRVHLLAGNFLGKTGLSGRALAVPALEDTR